MSDLLERLRAMAAGKSDDLDIAAEAIEEIIDLNGQIINLEKERGELRAENAELRSENAELLAQRACKFVAVWPGQTVFGPFDSLTLAHEVLLSRFGHDYKSFIEVWAVEPLTRSNNKTKENHHAD